MPDVSRFTRSPGPYRPRSSRREDDQRGGAEAMLDEHDPRAPAARRGPSRFLCGQREQIQEAS